MCSRTGRVRSRTLLALAGLVALLLVGSPPPALAQESPSPAPPATRHSGLREALEAARQAPSEEACRRHLEAAQALLSPQEPTRLRRIIGWARKAAWPAQARSLAQDAISLLDSGRNASSARPTSDEQEREARKKLTEILSRSEFTWSKRAQGFADRIQKALLSVLRRVARWLEGLGIHLPPEAYEWLGWGILSLSIVALALLLFVALKSAWSLPFTRSRAAPGEDAPEARLERILGSTEWWKKAEDEAARGEYRQAVRLLFLALLARLQETTSLRLRPGQTNWELLRQLRHDPRHATLEAATRLYESHWYAMRAAGPAAYEQLKTHYASLDKPPSRAPLEPSGKEPSS